MIKLSKIVLATLALGGLTASPLATAQAPTCDDIEFKPNVTDNFPNAADGCLEVVERDGALFAKFVAEVVSVRRGKVTMDIKTRDGASTRQVIEPPEGFRVMLDGRPRRVRDLASGQEIRIYLPADRWAVAQVEEPATPVVVAPLAPPPPPEPEPEMVAELPGTASPVPLLGLGGVLLVLLGAGLSALRRRG